MVKRRKRARIKIRNVISVIIIFICFIVFVYSLISIIFWVKSNKQNKEIKEKLQESIVIDDNKEDIEEDKYKIDFDTLKSQNNETIGYLKVNNTNVDYIVTQAKNNDYYLNHNFNKEWNRSGWIFADYRNKLDGTDTNIIIYGHNTKDGSMFGSLHNTLNSDWYSNEENLDIVFVDENKTNIYRVVSIYTINREDAFMPVLFKSDDEYEKFIKQIKSKSIHNFDSEINTNDKLLTLSTCTGNGSKRVIIHSKLVK